MKLDQEIRNLACGDMRILLVVTGHVLRRVEIEENSYWQIASSVS